jgi:Raf kinase inhibitor-like YbhB/YbcL family protein
MHRLAGERNPIMNRWALLTTSVALTSSVALFGCSKSMRETPSAAPGASTSALTVTSTAFTEGGLIPTELTCDGANAAPPLAWSDAPANTQSFAVIVEDPDANPSKPFVHWVVYNLAAYARDVSGARREGENDLGKLGYGGPCPPSGEHRYVFKVYALDTQLGNLDKPKAADLEKAMDGHVLAQGQLTAKYHRARI